MKILLTGGGTGGHLVPLLSVIDEIKKRDPDAGLLFLGPKSDFNETLRSRGIEVREINAGKFRRYFSLENLFDVFKVFVGIDEAIFHILMFKPDVVFSKGGFASVPAVVAASYLRKPVLTHESDTVPGFANRIIGKKARTIFISFPATLRYFPDHKIIMSGNPIRKDIRQGDRNRAQRFFGLRGDLPVVLVFGGSQGAQHMNDFLLGALPETLEKYQVIHITGSKNFEEIEKRIDGMNIPEEKKRRYKAYPYLDEEMKDAFALCDMVVSRAGASSLSEIIALGKPSLIIPLPSAANNHQYHNAKYFADEGLILMAEEKDLNAEKFLDKLDELAAKRTQLADDLKKFNAANATQDPAAVIAEEILKYKK